MNRLMGGLISLMFTLATMPANADLLLVGTTLPNGAGGEAAVTDYQNLAQAFTLTSSVQVTNIECRYDGVRN